MCSYILCLFVCFFVFGFVLAKPEFHRQNVSNNPFRSLFRGLSRSQTPRSTLYIGYTHTHISEHVFEIVYVFFFLLTEQLYLLEDVNSSGPLNNTRIRRIGMGFKILSFAVEMRLRGK